MKYNKIVFIGMMGAGKTTVANYLAQSLNTVAFDLDDLFIKKNNTSINDFFKKFGEQKFREKETELLKEVLLKDEFILSTGGGVVLSEINRGLLSKEDILTIYLSASSDTIYDRIKDDTSRPLLLVKDPKKEIEKILNERKKYYLTAKKTIITDNKTPEEIIKEIKWII